MAVKRVTRQFYCLGVVHGKPVDAAKAKKMIATAIDILAGIKPPINYLE